MTESRVTSKYRQAENHYGSTNRSSGWIGIEIDEDGWKKRARETGGEEGRKGDVPLGDELLFPREFILKAIFQNAPHRAAKISSDFRRARSTDRVFSSIMQLSLWFFLFILYAFFSCRSMETLSRFIFSSEQEVPRENVWYNSKHNIFLLHYIILHRRM